MARPLPHRSQASTAPAFTAFADGVRLWRTELLTYFDEPTTNGYTEGSSTK
jgi:transposase